MEPFACSDLVAHHAHLRPDNLCCSDLADNRRWTYQELDDDIQRAMTVLLEEGVSQGDRVATIAHNSVYQVVLHQALMRLGTIFVPLNWRLSLPELSKLLADCSPVILYTDSVGPLPKLPPGCRSRLISSFVQGFGSISTPAQRRCFPLAHSICMILYTSGTSGIPKGVKLTPQCLLATAVNFSVLGEVDPDSVFLCDSPMFHVIGIVVQIWAPLLQGGAFIVSPSFKAELTNERLGDNKLGITHYFCVPQMAEALCHAENFDPGRWTQLKALFTGGAPNPAARVLWWLDQGVRMVDGYGMTETGTTLGMPLSPHVIRAKAGSVGSAGPITTLRLVDEQDQDVEDGAPGELLIFGQNVTPGFWNKSEDKDAFTEAGGIRTGDIARRDQDGFYFLIDRKKDMYISGGENIYPAEIEAVLVQHPRVQQVAVIGVKDERWGEVGWAYVVAVPGNPLSRQDLVRHCRDFIGSYRTPKEFIFVNSLPRTGSGKVLKRVLRDKLLNKD
ncbi:putative acyl-CoA synthetase [Xylariales sp. AK1849]|nr:putative acyl-CoA synthetase [Xylariales sp. AK1849]